MAKFMIVLCALVACAAAKPGVVAPLAYTAPVAAAYTTPYAAAYATPYAAAYTAAYTTPLAYTAPAAVAAPLAYANAHLDAAYASSRVDIKQNYNAAVVPATYAAAPVAAAIAPVAASVAPLKYTAPLTAAVAAPLTYANAHLDAAYASSRVDIKQNYNAAVVPATYSAAVAPVAPLKYTAAPVLFSIFQWSNWGNGGSNRCGSISSWHNSGIVVLLDIHTAAGIGGIQMGIGIGQRSGDGSSQWSGVFKRSNGSSNWGYGSSYRGGSICGWDNSSIVVLLDINTAAGIGGIQMSISISQRSGNGSRSSVCQWSSISSGMIVLCALVACAAAKPGVVAPLTYTAPVAAAYTTPYAAAYATPYASAYATPYAAAYTAAYTAPAAVAAPLAYANAHLDAAYASSRVDIKQNYNAAVVPATYAATPVAAAVAPVAAPVAPLKYTAPLTAAVAAPLTYANAHLDAAYASSRVDIKQNYNAAVVPATYAATPVAAAVAPVAPLKYTAAPVLL
ncbi:uncharacterized protein LOC133336946 [Musca vetustissima]|uniref:uncharacterized protein LOC133336946 n=1 Tax=Musca vetustissima TaxID=27455 RepID=UPI002AB64AF0|nr:uncharacterized protein LOC133336946 [Musca vetustissima]